MGCFNATDEKIITHIVKGDTGDGVPNLLSDDAVLVTEGIKQKSVTSKRLAEFIDMGKDACRNDYEKRNWDRNIRMVSFDMIPEDVSQEIIDTYKAQTPKKDGMKIMTYLAKNKCRLLLNDIQYF